MPNHTNSNNKKKNNNNRGKSYENNSATKPAYEFSSYSSQQAYSNYYFGINIFDLYSREQLAELVKDPMGNNKILREISLILYGMNGTYTNTVDYMTAIPTLDKVIVTHGTNDNKKRKNKELMESTLRTIKDKEMDWKRCRPALSLFY